jgi:hypothetical protein
MSSSTGAREGLLEVDQLRPRRLDDDPHHRVVQRPDLGLPLGPLLRRHLVGAVHLEVLVGDAFDFVEHRFASKQQDLRGCTSVSMVRATAGFRRSDASFAAFVVVHMTTSVPFQANAIGTTLGCRPWPRTPAGRGPG